MLDHIPLQVRMVFYGVSFLAVVLIGLPWLAYRVDVYGPRWHIEIGWLRIVGGMLFLAFLSMYIFCSYVLSTRGRGPFVEFDPPREFVASGPYRWLRNPVAACLGGAVFSLAVALSSTGILLMFLFGLPLAHMQVVLLEEPLLRKRFGSSYEAYLRRVPRWIPRRPKSSQP
jgi:protein-S-isoprenylcysteine O-methyltransferase Ste14